MSGTEDGKAAPRAGVETAASRAAEEAPVKQASPRGRAADTVLIAVCVAIIAFLLAQVLTYGYGRDQGIYAMVARSILVGGMPYRDAWDFKPPGVFLVYALSRALFGSGPLGIRIVEAFGLAATVAVMVRTTHVLWGSARVGWVASALFLIVHAELDFWHTAQPESFGGMLTIFAVALALFPRSSERRRRLAWLGAGALFGAAGLLKPPLAGGGAALAAVLAWSERDRAIASGARWVRPALVPVALVALGGVLPLALCAAWFAAKGALGDLREVLFVFTPHYTALGWEGADLGWMIKHGLSCWLFEYSLVTTLGMLLLGVLGTRPREREGVLVLAGVILMHLAGVTMQGKFFPYHYGATWPCTALLAALGLDRLWDIAKARGGLRVLAFFGALGVLVWGQSGTKDVREWYADRALDRAAILAHVVSGERDDATVARDRLRLDELASVADVNAVANRAVGELLQSRVPEDRPVFVWGFEPVIYDLAARAPASRFLYDVPQRVAWAAPAMRDLLMSDLAARPPAAIVVERRDVFPMVTGNAIDSADTLPEFPALRDLLATRYELAATIEDFDVYFERSAD